MYTRLLQPSASIAGSCLVLALAMPVGEAGAQWTINLRAMRNPLPLGECTPVEVVVMETPGRQSPRRPDGKPLSGWDFEFSVSSPAPDAFRLQNDDPTRPFICAFAPTAPSATFTAHYPGRQLRPNEMVPGVQLTQSIEVAMEGMPAGVPAPAGYAAANPAYPSAPGTAGAYPGGPGYPAPGHSSGPAPASPYPAGAYPAGAYPADPAPAAAGYSQSGYPPPVANPPPSGALPAGPSQSPRTAGGEPGVTDTSVRSGKQFFKRITGFAKRKASEVATSTTTEVADATGEVIGTTLEAGGQVVKSGAGAVTGAASQEVQGVGQALGVRKSSGDPSDVAAALAGGRAVLRGLRFTEGTAILDPASGPLISQIAGALARTPGQFLIEAHVDGKHSPAAQALSEQRSAAVKAALVAAGSSPMQLAAVGYGASRPIAGASSSARIEIARTQ